MRAENDLQPEIQRHRAAIRRSDFSLPLKCVLRDNLLGHGDSLFDYGCGHGDDLRQLQSLGFASTAGIRYIGPTCPGFRPMQSISDTF